MKIWLSVKRRVVQSDTSSAYNFVGSRFVSFAFIAYRSGYILVWFAYSKYTTFLQLLVSVKMF